MNFELLWQICFAFLKLGAFSFGGGYAMLSFIQREMVDAHGWLAPADFVNMVAIAEMTPGPIAVNSSTFVGYNFFGVLGGILCSVCTLLIPFLLALTMAASFTKFKDNIHLKNALGGIRPAVIGLIAASCLSVAKISFTSWFSLVFFAIAYILVAKVKVNPILALVTCGALGGVFYGALLPALAV